MATTNPVTDINATETVAACAVFDTYELLESIIALVPAHQIHQLKGVSKTWKQLITSSSCIRKARCLLPDWADAPDPEYASNSQLRPHPIFHDLGSSTSVKTYRSDSRVFKTIVVSGDMAADKLGLWSTDYATSPRCRAMLLYEPALTSPLCTVYVKDGIKIKHLLEVRKALVKTHVKYVSAEPTCAFGEKFWFGFAERLGS